MCFYYSINTKKPDDIVKSGLISQHKLISIPKKLVVNGFERPCLPVISSNCVGEVEYFQWGLIPKSVNGKENADSFAKQYNTLNAKSETAVKSKTFGNAINNQRCLVLASGFFEWQHVNKQKIPYYITLSSENLFAFAGIWDCWSDEQGQQHFTYTILTTQANELMSRIHNTKKRMPIILPTDQLSIWLSTQINKNNLNSYLRELASPELKAHTIKPFLSDHQQITNDDILAPYNYENGATQNNSNNTQLTIGF